MNLIAPSRSGSATASNSGLLVAGWLLAIVAIGLPSWTERSWATEWPPARTVDRARLERAGVRVLEGRHVTLVTDLPSQPAVDELPQVVDAAVPLLAERFEIQQQQLSRWRVLACVMQDAALFDRLGLLSERHPDFPEGLSIGYELWLHEQPSDYYRRHLLLHELTHSFMATQLGSCGPGWYMEGMAELLGTHQWQSSPPQLQLGGMPPSRDAVPMWGRIQLVREAAAAGRWLAVPAVMQIDNRQILDTESYAWVWALAHFLEGHPRYRDRFRAMSREVLSPRFSGKCRRLYARDWDDLQTEWRLFAATLVYGHDLKREAIDFIPSRPLPGEGGRLEVRADRGWQSTGWTLQGGKQYAITAAGRFMVGEEGGQLWPAEAGGVTIEYHAGYPLGMLLASIRPEPDEGDQGEHLTALLHPQKIGLSATVTPARTGTLFLRVNDSPGQLWDNQGTLRISIKAK